MQKRRVVFLRARRPRFLGRLASCFPKQRENRLPMDRTSFLLRPAVFRGVACVCVCVCVPWKVYFKDGSGKTLGVAMEPCLARSVCSRRISIGRARLVFAAGLEAGPGRPVCLCACLVLETVFGIVCVRVCVCVCSMPDLLEGRKWQNPQCCDGALFGFGVCDFILCDRPQVFTVREGLSP